MLLGCIHALLLATASTELDVNGRSALQQHAGEPAVSSAASLPPEIYELAGRGELREVIKWLPKGGPVDALGSSTTADGRTATTALLHAAAANDRLETVGELLKRGASVDLPSSYGSTALMAAASHGHLSILRFLLKHSANPELQSTDGHTALMLAASQGHEACVQALLRARANTELLDKHGRTALRWAESHGHTAIARLLRQHAAPPQPAAAAPATPLDAGEPAESSAASLPLEILKSAERGELRKVVEWLRKGGAVDALASVVLAADGRPANVALLHSAAANDHLKMARELLKRGASVDLPTSLDDTPLMTAASLGRLSILLVLLQHSANPDLQNNYGHTALTLAAAQGHEACVQALLRAKANTELFTKEGRTALKLAEIKGHTAIARLLRQHAKTCLSLGLGLALCAALPPTWSWLVLSVVLGAIAAVAFSRTLTARAGQDRAARQRRPHRTARHAKAQGRTTTKQPIRQQHAAPPQPAATVAPHHTLRAEQAARTAWTDGAMEEPLVEEAAEQARSKKSKKRNKAGRAAAAGDEPSEATPPGAPAPPPAAAPKPVASAAERAEAALRAAIAGGAGLSALEAALAAAPHEVQEGGVGAEAAAAATAVGLAAERAAAEAQTATDKAQAAAEERAAAAEQDRAAAEQAAEEHAAAAEHAAATAERAALELAAAERAAEDRHVDEAVARSMTSLQADEERRRTTASSAAAPTAPPPTCHSSRPANGGPSRAGLGDGRGGRGVPGGGRGGSGAGRDGGAAVPSAQPVLTLADAGDITGRIPVPESTIGGETTCIVCMAHPKSHLAVPCGHQCVCDICAERMQDCPYCRAAVQQWVHARVV